MPPGVREPSQPFHACALHTPNAHARWIELENSEKEDNGEYSKNGK